MKERPILFGAPMVRAILDGRKTQTRRVVKGEALRWLNDGFTPEFVADYQNNLCRHGKAGERLWVREAWRIGAWNEDLPAVALDYCDGPRKEWVGIPDPCCDDGELFNRLWQQSTDDALAACAKYDDDGNFKWDPGQSPCRWRPSIHMPRWASRITLEITDVRVERLKDISEKDAWAEGCEGFDDDVSGGKSGYCEYAELWEAINGKGSWEPNPWVWVIEFRRVEA